MKDDITIPKVEDVGIAVVLEQKEGEEAWYVYLINYKNEPLKNVLVSSKGYGMLNNQHKKTVTFSHFLDSVPANSAKKIEAITEEVFPLNNEYFLTFYIDKLIYDRKYIFVPETIKKENLIHISILDKKGVLIK